MSVDRLFARVQWIVIALIAVGSTVRGVGLINDAVILPPDYHTFSPPAQVGGSYIDPAFGSHIVRITNCERFGTRVLGGYFSNSEICFFNKDGSYFIAAENEIIDGQNLIANFLYNGITGTRIKMLGLYDNTMRPYYLRWALADRYKVNGDYVTFEPVYHFYLYHGNEIRLYDVRDIDNYVVLRTFDEYESIGPAGGEGDISDDGRYWCLDGNGTELFVYDLIDDIKYPVSTFDLGSLGSKGTEVGVDYAAVSPSGDFVLVSWGTDPALGVRYHGIEVYDKSWNFIHQIYPGIIHWEVGVDVFGDEVLYAVAPFGHSEYYEAFGINAGDIMSVRLSDGHHRLLKHIPKWAHFSMTACNSVTDGRYLYVSYLANSDDPEELWWPFWGEIIEVPTDGSGLVRRLAHHRTREVPGEIDKYWQADAVVNRQGTKILYRSTYLASVGDLYMFDITDRDESHLDTTPPNPPQWLRSPFKTSSRIQLEWDPPGPAADGDTARFYRVYRDDALIAEPFDIKYLDTGLNEFTSYKYDVYSVDKAGIASLTAATDYFSTLGDTTTPRLVTFRLENRTHIALRFSEPMDRMSAEDVNNYEIDNEITIFSASLRSDSVTVNLEMSLLELGEDYLLQLHDITDMSQSGNSIPENTSVAFSLLADYFDDFENGVAENWQFAAAERWSVQIDEIGYSLFLNTSDYDSPGNYALGEIAILTPSKWQTNEFRMRFLARSAEDLLSNRDADYAMLFGYVDDQNYYYVQFHSYDVSINRVVDGARVSQSKYAVEIPFEGYQTIGVDFIDDTLKVFFNEDELLSQFLDNDVQGRLGLGSYNDAVYFDNVNIEVITEPDLTPPNPPENLVLVDRSCSTLTIAWDLPLQAQDGEYATYYKVYRDLTFIAEAESLSFADSGLDEATDYQYDIYSVDRSGLTSLSCVSQTFTTRRDTIPPDLVFARVLNPAQVFVRFTEPVEDISSEIISNYSLTPHSDIVAAELQPDDVSIVLTVGSIVSDTDYRLDVSGVYDRARVPNVCADNTYIVFQLNPSFVDDFENGLSSVWSRRTAQRWNIQQDGGSNRLYLNTTDYDTPGDKLLGEYAIIDNDLFFVGDFQLIFQGRSAEDLLENSHADYAVVFGFIDEMNYSYVQFHSYNIGINQIVDGSRVTFEAFPLEIDLTHYQRIEVSVERDTVRTFINDVPSASYELPFYSPGKIGLGSFNDSVFFDDFFLQAFAQSDTIPPAPPQGLQLILVK